MKPSSLLTKALCLSLLSVCLTGLTAVVPIPFSSEPRATVVNTNDDLILNATNNGAATWTTKRATVKAVATAMAPLLGGTSALNATTTNAWRQDATNAATAIAAQAAQQATNALPGLITNLAEVNAEGFLPVPISPPVNVIFQGDSLTQEAGTGTDSPHNAPYSTYPLYLRRIWTNNINSWANYAVGGMSLRDITNQLGTILASLPTGTNNLMLLRVGANDFVPVGGGSITNATIWLSTWENYCSNIQSAGIKLVVFTVQDRYPWAGTAAYQDFRKVINRGIRASQFHDYLVDLDYASPSMATNVNWRTYDGTHANTNGATWEAQYIARCIGLAANLGPEKAAANTTGKVQNPITTNLQVWLKADATSYADGTATNWPDSSGNGFNATNIAAFQPAYKASVINGQPAYLFAKTNVLISPYAAAASNFTFFAVWKGAGPAEGEVVIDKNWANGMAFTAYPGVYWEPYALGAVAQVVSSRNDWMLGAAVRVGTKLCAYGPGNLSATNSCVATALDTSTIYLGANHALGGAFVGYLAEFLFYDTALSDSARAGVMSYLNTKYFGTGVTNVSVSQVQSTSLVGMIPADLLPIDGTSITLNGLNQLQAAGTNSGLTAGQVAAQIQASNLLSVATAVATYLKLSDTNTFATNLRAYSLNSTNDLYAAIVAKGYATLAGSNYSTAAWTFNGAVTFQQGATFGGGNGTLSGTNALFVGWAEVDGAQTNKSAATNTVSIGAPDMYATTFHGNATSASTASAGWPTSWAESAITGLQADLSSKQTTNASAFTNAFAQVLPVPGTYFLSTNAACSVTGFSGVTSTSVWTCLLIITNTGNSDFAFSCPSLVMTPDGARSWTVTNYSTQAGRRIFTAQGYGQVCTNGVCRWLY